MASNPATAVVGATLLAGLLTYLATREEREEAIQVYDPSAPVAAGTARERPQLVNAPGAQPHWQTMPVPAELDGAPAGVVAEYMRWFDRRYGSGAGGMSLFPDGSSSPGAEFIRGAWRDAAGMGIDTLQPGPNTDAGGTAQPDVVPMDPANPAYTRVPTEEEEKGYVDPTIDDFSSDSVGSGTGSDRPRGYHNPSSGAKRPGGSIAPVAARVGGTAVGVGLGGYIASQLFPRNGGGAPPSPPQPPVPPTPPAPAGSGEIEGGRYKDLRLNFPRLFAPARSDSSDINLFVRGGGCVGVDLEASIHIGTLIVALLTVEMPSGYEQYRQLHLNQLMHALNGNVDAVVLGAKVNFQLPHVDDSKDTAQVFMGGCASISRFYKRSPTISGGSMGTGTHNAGCRYITLKWPRANGGAIVWETFTPEKLNIGSVTDHKSEANAATTGVLDAILNETGGPNLDTNILRTATEDVNGAITKRVANLLGWNKMQHVSTVQLVLKALLYMQSYDLSSPMCRSQFDEIGVGPTGAAATVGAPLSVLSAVVGTFKDYVLVMSNQATAVAGFSKSDLESSSVAVIPIRNDWLQISATNAAWTMCHVDYPHRDITHTGHVVCPGASSSPNTKDFITPSACVKIYSGVTRVCFVLVEDLNTGSGTYMPNLDVGSVTLTTANRLIGGVSVAIDAAISLGTNYYDARSTLHSVLARWSTLSTAVGDWTDAMMIATDICCFYPLPRGLPTHKVASWFNGGGTAPVAKPAGYSLTELKDAGEGQAHGRMNTLTASGMWPYVLHRHYQVEQMSSLNWIILARGWLSDVSPMGHSVPRPASLMSQMLHASRGLAAVHDARFQQLSITVHAALGGIGSSMAQKVRAYLAAGFTTLYKSRSGVTRPLWPGMSGTIYDSALLIPFIVPFARLNCLSMASATSVKELTGTGYTPTVATEQMETSLGTYYRFPAVEVLKTLAAYHLDLSYLSVKTTRPYVAMSNIGVTPPVGIHSGGTSGWDEALTALTTFGAETDCRPQNADVPVAYVPPLFDVATNKPLTLALGPWYSAATEVKSETEMSRFVGNEENPGTSFGFDSRFRAIEQFMFGEDFGTSAAAPPQTGSAATTALDGAAARH